MTEKSLLRFAMILQDQAPSTLDKYICRLVEAVLQDDSNGATLHNLGVKITEQFGLTFTDEEIRSAISRKGKSRIICSNDLFQLSASAKRAMSTQVPLTDKLNSTIKRFSATNSIEMPVDAILALILKYLYYCFNSNVSNLLHLFAKEAISYEHTAFEAGNDAILIINAFITWDDVEKDQLVYKLVATCYEYCMLTIKKDSMLGRELFKGKRFYLDANIIFRLAGIHNEERKTVTREFVRHCQEVGIELFLTSVTLDEIYRVISSQIGFIKGIAGYSMPLSCEALQAINPDIDISDFYKAYCSWCETPGNKCGDFISFNNYLQGLIRQTLDELKFKGSSAYKATKSVELFRTRVDSLKEYKNSKRSWRPVSVASAETDITNVMDTIEWRQGAAANMWQTSDFIVSADQLLIGWANETFPGIPLVVLPSVWLSIILRFSGRTDDDYKSFCLFLTQRQHINSNEMVDPIELLRNINVKTSDINIKEQILMEITQNKSQYPFDKAEDYATNTDRAFDKVLKDIYKKTKSEISAVREQMQQEISTLAEKSQHSLEQHSKIAADNGMEIAVISLSKSAAAKKVKLFRAVGNYSWAFKLLGGIALVFGVVAWAFELQPLYGWMYSVSPEKLQNSSSLFALTWSVFSMGAGLLFGGIGKGIESLGSDKRENKLYNRYYQENMKKVREAQDS